MRHKDHASSLDDSTEACKGFEPFITCSDELEAGFTANCDALLFMFECEDREQNILQIAKTLRHLVSIVFKGRVRDNRVRN